MRFLRFLDALLDRLFVVLGAFAGSQIPEFMQQYTQRLAGHVEELRHLLDGLRQIALHSNKSLEQYIQKFSASPDPDFARQGEFMQTMLQRWEELNQALLNLVQSPMWERPYVFMRDLNYPIAKATLHAFQPGLNLTIEGLCYTGIGLLIGFGLYKALSTLFALGYTRVTSLFKQNA
ncbi:DUF2937 family protein [Candidatus Protochlamydia phocaeensis]|uniref:DUF2937 family protein n=1 Tax=Candidatus Protochlamydia phocaeensis TaxID=1414722 RepID=UPI000839376F|nr:DUF2937 family protein [Candidatus Protochlamydia phocaeensis]